MYENPNESIPNKKQIMVREYPAHTQIVAPDSFSRARRCCWLLFTADRNICDGRRWPFLSIINVAFSRLTSDSRSAIRCFKFRTYRSVFKWRPAIDPKHECVTTMFIQHQRNLRKVCLIWHMLLRRFSKTRTRFFLILEDFKFESRC